jgi:hypothetical protein
MQMLAGKRVFVRAIVIDIPRLRNTTQAYNVEIFQEMSWAHIK